ncbi:uncharacterized protein P884DRAFT_287778 [Thermothelomyces heterothallicus CBS 202.75]|uniref:uncharacterized protein n=1 Tax=Thermothelomyces heterothallicus CBS 202.75 TaxID=1149848 RepID=UPI003744569A
MASSATIKAIESSTVHQIQSGQVIVDLCSVAKELVENSIDAGATAIEVRFKNQGLDSIEVQDNGSGIAPHNYESVALKHYTSKLSSYDDLSELQTFGFRGEALSSLCALSRFAVVTCTQQDVPRATRLEFETSGKLKSTSVVSGQRGTTVIVEDLFRSLPVRRRELERNIKREWGKVVSLLNQYACVQTGVKFTVSQQPTKGKRMILFSTKGNSTTRENIINVFGVKTMNALIPMDLKLELIPTAGPLIKGKTRGGDGGTTEVRVLGHVSRPNHGEGRQTPDRQMFYVNGRPCGLPQFAKVFNEVYRLYNASQSPFIFADIQLDTHLYDVNVSPDKRTILLHDQGQMLDNLRESLIELFETQDVTIPVSHSQGLKQTSFKTASGRSWTPASAQVAKRDAAVEPQRSAEPTSPIHSGQLTERGEDEEELNDAQDDAQSTTQPEADDESRAGKQASPESAGSKKTVTLLSRWLAKGADDDREPVDQVTRAQGQADAVSNNHRDPESTILSVDHSPRGPAAEERTPEAAEIDESRRHQVQSQRAARRSPTSTDVMSPGEETQSRGPNGEPERPVAAIAPPSQSPAPRAVAVSTARPFKRSSQEVATITIGDHTVTSLIGNPTKRTKVAEAPKLPKVTATGKTGTRGAALPTFGGRLSQLFSAPARPGDGPVEGVEVVAQDSEEDMQESGGDVEREEDGDGEEEEGDSLFVPQSEVAHVEDEEVDLPCPGQAEDTGFRSNADVPMESVEDLVARRDDESADDHGHSGGEEQKVLDGKRQQLMEAAAAASESTGEGEMRSQLFVKGRSKRKDMTLNLVQKVKTSPDAIQKRIAALTRHLPAPRPRASPAESPDGLEAEDAEEKLSLKICKSDFGRMRIVGQFNLGFILAVREAASLEEDRSEGADDELFIIDQHASDEKYNFERLQATTTVQSQRLVQPKTLDLTALEEEIVLEHLPDLERNGFLAQVDTSGAKPVGSRVQLLSLPLSRETTFSLADLEELLFLLADNPTSSASTVPRPSKVRKMFAMRACRSSIMIGKALSRRQMETVVRHMGEMEKPWNCPHGRPTMRHLCGLGAWDGRGWVEEEERTDWAGWVREKREEQDQ